MIHSEGGIHMRCIIKEIIEKHFGPYLIKAAENQDCIENS